MSGARARRARPRQRAGRRRDGSDRLELEVEELDAGSPSNEAIAAATGEIVAGWAVRSSHAAALDLDGLLRLIREVRAAVAGEPPPPRERPSRREPAPDRWRPRR